MQKNIFIIEKLKKYLKCPALCVCACMSVWPCDPPPPTLIYEAMLASNLDGDYAKIVTNILKSRPSLLSSWTLLTPHRDPHPKNLVSEMEFKGSTQAIYEQACQLSSGICEILPSPLKVSKYPNQA